MKPGLNTVELTTRKVIQGKLLTALDDETKVACLFTKEDLEDLIFACKLWPMRDSRATRLGALMRGMEQLLEEAFLKLPTPPGAGQQR